MSSPHDFDFLHGEWEVRHRRRTDFLDAGSAWEEFPSTVRCWPLFDGAANIDEIDMPHLGAKGLTLRLFDRESRLWSLNWSSSSSGRLFPPVIGCFGGNGNALTAPDADPASASATASATAPGTDPAPTPSDGRRDRGEFYGDDTHDGKDVRARFVWSGVSETSARWEQAFSLDGGKTWLTNWVMDFTRPETSQEPVSGTPSA
ncbi:hypothetical protein ACWCPF_12305 [Streptomyces sp. NPDC001858]